MRWIGRADRTAHPDNEMDPEAFLKWSMDVHAAMNSFRAVCSIAASDSNVSSQSRSICYLAPNKYKIVSTSSNQFVQTSVSDGVKVAEYGNRAEMPAVVSPAPRSFSDADTVFMRHPMFCGSLLYRFFSGGRHFDMLHQEDKGAVRNCGIEIVDGARCRMIGLYGPGSYGNVRVWIDETTGVVRRISYDSEPQLERMRKGLDPELLKALQKRLENLPPGPARDSIQTIVQNGFTPQSTSDTTESYVQIQVGSKVSVDEFDVTVPSGRQIREIASH